MVMYCIEISAKYCITMRLKQKLYVVSKMFSNETEKFGMDSSQYFVEPSLVVAMEILSIATVAHLTSGL